MIAISDVDDVLLHTGGFVEDLKNFICSKEFGISEAEYNDFKKEMKEQAGGVYDMDVLLDIIADKKKIEKSVLELGVKQVFENLKNRVFPDVINFLDKIGKENVFLVSFGDQKLQQRKLESMGILDYVKDYIITSGSKADAIKELIKKHNIPLDTEKWFLDDRLNHLEEVSKIKKEYNIKNYRVNRSEGRHDDECKKCEECGEVCDFEITDLQIEQIENNEIEFINQIWDLKEKKKLENKNSEFKIR